MRVTLHRILDAVLRWMGNDWPQVPPYYGGGL